MPRKKTKQKNSKKSSGIVKISNLAPKSFLSNAFSNYKKNKEILELLLEVRNKARDKKDYELADKIRNELLDKGILIEDKDGKTTWKIK